MTNSRNQNGSALVVIIIVVVVSILGVLGYVAWNNLFGKEEGDANAIETTNTADGQKEEVVYKTIQIDEYTFRYPLNKNNEKISIVLDESTPALQITYAPVRNYYSDKVGEDYKYCNDYVAGLVSVITEDEFSEYRLLPYVEGKEAFSDALADGRIVQVENRDLYLAGPAKQNESCAHIYESEDIELKNILSDMQNVRLEWLKSLELVE